MIVKLYLDLVWLDNNGKKGYTRINFPVVALSNPALLPAISAIVDALIQALDCRLETAKLYLTRKPDVLAEPQPGSDVYRAAVLIYRDGVTYGTVEIRSPLPSFFEVSGMYANVRISQDVYQSSAELSQLGSLLTETVLPTTGEAFPSTFIVGGRTSQ